MKGSKMKYGGTEMRYVIGMVLFSVLAISNFAFFAISLIPPLSFGILGGLFLVLTPWSLFYFVRTSLYFASKLRRSENHDLSPKQPPVSLLQRKDVVKENSNE